MSPLSLKSQLGLLVLHTPRRIAILHDSPAFGGHERAFLAWLPALLGSHHVEQLDFSIACANTRFVSALERVEHTKVRIHRSEFVKGWGEPYRAPLRARYGRWVRQLVAGARSDLVLLLQGRIENLATPMLWLSRRLEIVSYLPMAHRAREMDRPPVAAQVSDLLRRPYYARPQRFIVPSESIALQARRAGARAPIFVVENVPSAFGHAPRNQARRALGLPIDKRIALFMGRLELHQKGLDRLLGGIVNPSTDESARWELVFVGEGPAEHQIRAALSEPVVSGRLIDWTSTPQQYLSAADIVLMPSRFEGVPLVLLEALQCGTPVLGSDIDVFREYLPRSNLRDFAKPLALFSALDELTSDEAVQRFRRHAEGIRSRLDLRMSQERFVRALIGTETLDRAWTDGARGAST